MKDEKVKQRVKLCVAIAVFIIIIIMVIIQIIDYNFQGEDQMPFELSKVTVVSTAEGKKGDGWKFNINQNNDIYISIERNEKYPDAKIESISIENIQTYKASEKGAINLYMPASTEERTLVNSDEYKIEDSLTYKGGKQTDYKNLIIGNQGGTLIFRVANDDVSEYMPSDDEAVKHDGTLLNKTGISSEDLNFNISFDIVIKLKNKSYRGRMNMDMPCGDILTEGMCNIEKNDFSDVVFKRE